MSILGRGGLFGKAYGTFAKASSVVCVFILYVKALKMARSYALRCSALHQ